jgi:hypothetical protein
MRALVPLYVSSTCLLMKPVNTAFIQSVHPMNWANSGTGFHGVMATTILHLNNLTSKPEGLFEARRHISHTFRLVHRKLSGQSAVTDETIAVIVSMTQYEHYQHEYQQGSVHVHGLRRIAQLRGGLLQLVTGGSGLAQKMLRYG